MDLPSCEADLREDGELARFVVKGKVTGRQLGSGCYGSVEEVEVDGKVSVVKIIHDHLIVASNNGASEITEKYIEECELLSNLRHPNITSFLGICFLPECPHPLLVTEKLDGSLDDLLETIPGIPLAVKYSILEGVANGLVYLHAHNPQIVHADLTAKNVLLTTCLLAKVSDFRNSHLVNIQPDFSSSSTTLVYKSPDSLHDIPTHSVSPSVDVFSFGHIILFTLTQVFPGDLLDVEYVNPMNPNKRLRRSEVERRKKYFELLSMEDMIAKGQHHPLAQLSKECLNNNPAQRPTAEHLVTALDDMQKKLTSDSSEVSKVDAVRQVAATKELLERYIQVREKVDKMSTQSEEIQRLQKKLEHAQSQEADKEAVSGLQYKQENKNTLLVEHQHSLMHLKKELERKEEQFLYQLQQKNSFLQREMAELIEKDARLSSIDKQLQQIQKTLEEKLTELSVKDSPVDNQESGDLYTAVRVRSDLQQSDPLQQHKEPELQLKMEVLKFKDALLQKKDEELVSMEKHFCKLQVQHERLKEDTKLKNANIQELMKKNKRLSERAQQIETQLKTSRNLQQDCDGVDTLKEARDELQLKEQQLHQKDVELRSKDEKILDLEARLLQKDEELTSKRDKLQCKEQQHHHTVAEYQEKLSKAYSMVEVKENMIKQLTVELKDKESVLERNEMLMLDKERELTDKDKEMKQLDTSFQNRIWQLNEDLKHKDRELERKTLEFKEKYQEFNPKEDEFQQVNQEVKKMEFQLQKKKDKIQQLSEELREKCSEFEQQECDLCQHSSSLHRKESDQHKMSELEYEKDELRQNIVEYQQTINQTNKQLQDKDAELKQKIDEVNRKKTELIQVRIALLQKNNELQQNKRELSKLNCLVHERNNEFYQMCQDLKMKSDELEQKNEDIVRGKVTLQQKVDIIKELTEELELKDIELKEIVQEKEDELQEKTKEIEQLQTELQEKNNEIQLKQKIDEINRKNTELIQVRISLLQKNNELQQNKRELSKLNSLVHERNNEFHQMCQDLKMKSDELEQKNEDIVRGKVTLQQKVDKIKELTEELELKDVELKEIVQEKDNELQEKTKEIEELQTELQEKNNEIQQTAEDLKHRKLEITTLSENLKNFTELKKEEQVKDTSTVMEEICQLKAAQCVLRTDLDQKNADVLRLREELLNMKERFLVSSSMRCTTRSVGRLLPPHLKMQWRRGKDMPVGIHYHPQAVILRGKVYLGGGKSERSNQVFVYEPKQELWAALPPYKYVLFTMTVMNNQLVLVGGEDTHTKKKTNSLGVWNKKRCSWTHPFRPMLTACSSPAVVTYQDKWLIVAGGRGQSGDVSDAAVMDISNNYWYSAPPLPVPASTMSTTVINNSMVVLGGTNDSNSSKKVFAVTMDDFIWQAIAREITSNKLTPNVPAQTPWQKLADTPFSQSTAVTLNGALLAVGGHDCSAIHLYHPESRSWVKVGDMPAERVQCASTVLPHGEVLLAGGLGADSERSRMIEILTTIQ